MSSPPPDSASAPPPPPPQPPPLGRLTKLASIPAHTDRVWQGAAHPLRPLLVTVSGDKTCCMISLHTYRRVSTIDGGHKRAIRAVAWKPGRDCVFATGSFDATAGIWRRDDKGGDDEEGGGGGGGGEMEEDVEGEGEREEWRWSVVLDGHESEVKSVAWSAGGTFLATCSRDKSVWVWEEMEEDGFETVAVLQEHSQDVKCVQWHPEELLLASSSYDDDIRLYKEDIDDWACCALLRGHTSTVWSIVFEPPTSPLYSPAASSRLASCSDDLTIRIWSRVTPSPSPKNSNSNQKPGAVPSILRHSTPDEDWVQTAVLPKVHERSVYAVAWSGVTGRIVSCGGDGRVVVYEEVEVPAEHTVSVEDTVPAEDTAMREAPAAGDAEDVSMRNGSSGEEGANKEVAEAQEAKEETKEEEEEEKKEEQEQEQEGKDSVQPKTKREWRIVALAETAHGVFEINHVVWSHRYRDPRHPKDEIVVTCGDDGEVGIWEVEDKDGVAVEV